MSGYFSNVEAVRSAEYPALADSTYLDHAGTTLYPKSLIAAFSSDLTQNLFGNPHSASASSQLSSQRIDDVRLEVLRFFNAPEDRFDVVFTVNATAAIKLVADAFRDHPSGFDYAYHIDSHTSLVGVREIAQTSRCLTTADALSVWLKDRSGGSCTIPGLFAYPGQSNMTGVRNSLNWSAEIRKAREYNQTRTYCLYDAAALASTSPLDLSDVNAAPDFTAVSFYKIFGFPDLGALVVRQDAADAFAHRKYFGGGTVDSVAVTGEQWHATKQSSLHTRLEDGTLPFHNIMALHHALKIHKELFGSMKNIAHHCRYLTTKLRQDMTQLRHGNGQLVCRIHGLDAPDSGPVIAFNLLDECGKHVSNAEVEKLAIVRKIHLRTGGLCNPGGTATYINLTPEEMRQHYAAGYRCGSENDLINGKATGTIRVSFGAMSSLADVDTFLAFLREFYVDVSDENVQAEKVDHVTNGFVIESLTVFPIKSGAAYNIPPETSWEVGPRGLAWDREWCLVHEGTYQALSQKKYPRMALLRPTIDLQQRLLTISHNIHGTGWQRLALSLDNAVTTNQSLSICSGSTALRSSSVCGEAVDIEHYTSPETARFFTNALGVPCTLARFPRSGALRQATIRGQTGTSQGSIALANESPILLVSRSSVNRLNEQIKTQGGIGKTVPAESFRGNIIIAQDLPRGLSESPYAEDDWTRLSILNAENQTDFQVIGPCQRCQMICIDQGDASRRSEPFSTLAKARRRDGKVWFGMHMALLQRDATGGESRQVVRVGDRIVAS